MTVPGIAQRAHVPASAAQFARFAQSDDEKLRDIGTYGFTLLASGAPPKDVDLSAVPENVWKLDLGRELTDIEQGMRRSTPEFSPTQSSRRNFWLDWYFRNKDKIESQVEAAEALLTNGSSGER